MIFILYFFFFFQVLNKLKDSDCEKYIKYYLKNNNYDFQEYCNIDNLNPYSKCYNNNKFNIIEVCKKDILKLYKIRTNTTFDFENPKTFNEKIQWMKLYDNNPLKTQLTDKYLVREWIKEKIGEKYLIPLYGVWNSFDEIDFNKLPEQYVLKTNHGCGYNIIVKEKSDLNLDTFKNTINKWMEVNYAFLGYEFQYLYIKPKIIAEKYIENVDGDLYDYKVFCFNGKAESIMFLSDRKSHLKMSFYDLKWNKLDYVYSFPFNNITVPRPKNLKLLIELAEKLAEGFPHVRVDFYILNDDSIKFGEMTFSSASGICKWNPPKQDKIFGDLITLPSKRLIPPFQ